METAIPSGMLCIAIATAIGTAILGSTNPAEKVAIPSGKLWIAIMSAENRPILISFLSVVLGLLISSTLRISCGFS